MGPQIFHNFIARQAFVAGTVVLKFLEMQVSAIEKSLLKVQLHAELSNNLQISHIMVLNFVIQGKL